MARRPMSVPITARDAHGHLLQRLLHVGGHHDDRLVERGKATRWTGDPTDRRVATDWNGGTAATRRGHQTRDARHSESVIRFQFERLDVLPSEIQNLAPDLQPLSFAHLRHKIPPNVVRNRNEGALSCEDRRCRLPAPT